jgi:hypothetical protein
MHLRGTQRLMPPLRRLVRRLRLLPRLPVNQPRRRRLPPRGLAVVYMHAQSVDPICTCALRSLGVAIYVKLLADRHELILTVRIPRRRRTTYDAGPSERR